MAREDWPAEQGDALDLARKDRESEMEEEPTRRDPGDEIRGIGEDELEEEDEFEEGETEDLEEDEEEGIR